MYYRDKSFCNKDDCFKRHDCKDYFSERHEKLSKKVGLPISFMKDPICYKPEKRNVRPN